MLTFLKNLKSEAKIVIVSAMIILGLLAVNRYNHNRYLDEKDTRVRTEANLKAAQDSIRITETKYRTREYNRLTYMAKDLKELKDLNASLAKEVEMTKGKVIAIQKAGYKIIHDTIYAEVDEPTLIDGVLVVKAGYDTVFSPGNYRSIATLNKYSFKDSVFTQSITKDEIGFTAVTGLKKTDVGYEIFVRPSYPNMKLVALEGAMIGNDFFKQPKSKTPLFTLGAHVGYTPVSYDLGFKQFNFHPTRISASIGLNINLSKQK